MIKFLCTEIIDPTLDRRDLEMYLSYRLIPLDKFPGVRPIGIGEVLRRIFGKVSIAVILPDIIKEVETDAILLFDAFINAFNALNRKVFYIILIIYAHLWQHMYIIAIKRHQDFLCLVDRK